MIEKLSIRAFIKKAQRHFQGQLFTAKQYETYYYANINSATTLQTCIKHGAVYQIKVMVDKGRPRNFYLFSPSWK